MVYNDFSIQLKLLSAYLFLVRICLKVIQLTGIISFLKKQFAHHYLVALFSPAFAPVVSESGITGSPRCKYKLCRSTACRPHPVFRSVPSSRFPASQAF